MQARLVLLSLAIVSACALADLPRTTRSIHRPSIDDPPRRSSILTNEVTSESSRQVNRLMGGHLKQTSTTPPEEEEDDEAHWDDGLILSSAGNGKESKKPEEDDDAKKTLAQQVKEGKYGLIQNEIYPEKPKRPGIISYSSNPEVPKDSAKNLGGLDEEEIWLAENHVLVLRGGNFPEHETDKPTSDRQGWSPIDDYQAPKRQVKIPTSPKVPPPFPVQLNEGGPVTVLGSNNTEKPQWFDGLIPANETFLSRWNETEESLQSGKTIKPGAFLAGLIGPFVPSLPRGAVFLPPPSNQSDYDEDDQSIYYPPPYSFKYNQDNTTAVPPGPLVPGIILPPPPDFFSQLDEKKTTKSHITKYPKRTSTTPKSDTFIRKSHPKPHKYPSSSTLSSKDPRPFTMKPLNKFKHKNLTSFTETTEPPKQVLPLVEVTTSSPNEVSTLEISEVNTVRPIVTNQVIDTSTEDKSERPSWSGLAPKSQPIVAYYASSPSPIDEAVNDAIDIKAKTIKPRRPQPSAPSSASYYFYEEASDEVSGATPTPVYFQEKTPRVEDLYTTAEHQTKKPFYVDVTPSQQTRQHYSVQIIEPVIKTSSPRYQYTDPASSTNLPVSGRPQSQRMLSDSPIFFKTVTDRPQLHLHAFFTSPAPERTIQHKPKPVYQYSFEAADYAHRGRQKEIYKPIQEVQQKQVTFNEWQDEIQDVGQQYNDYEAEIPEQRLQPERSHYRTRVPSFPTTTIRPNTVDSTPNPEHAYYTKQEERFLDDVTREYFTNFGKKITKNRLSSTTPIYGKSSVTERPTYSTANSFSTNSFEDRRKAYNTPRVKVHYGDQTQRPFSLEGDTRVNYQRPLPAINPESEFLPGYGPKEREQIESFRAGKPLSQYIPVDGYSRQIGEPGFVPLTDTRKAQELFPARPIPLAGDIDVNYRDPRPPINPDAEFIDSGANGGQDKPSSYFAYSLPGDGGHFYFLTPHAISRRQQRNSFLYPSQRGARLTRTRRGPSDG